MKTISFENREQWLQARMGKVTGTRLGDMIPKKNGDKKIAFYEVIAERLSVSEMDFEGYMPNETPMDRGTRLQKYAIDKFRKTTGKQVNESLVLWVRDDNESVALSPDGVISEEEAIETKCLSSARHIEAYLNNKIPDDYEYQTLQYFIVNPKLQKLYVTFFDPRLPCKDFFYITLNRADVQAECDLLLAMQLRELADVEVAINKLTNF